MQKFSAVLVLIILQLLTSGKNSVAEADKFEDPEESYRYYYSQVFAERIKPTTPSRTLVWLQKLVDSYKAYTRDDPTSSLKDNFSRDFAALLEASKVSSAKCSSYKKEFKSLKQGFNRYPRLKTYIKHYEKEQDKVCGNSSWLSCIKLS